ncbi:hypothetical protein [Methylobacterium oryzisoli]|uniref:hypothetical protein n=1 Tax=Methylobacterium oryzisoli TaxID=3385502 RepID=UPI0038928954
MPARPRPLAALICLVSGALLAAGPARAQPSWVDPPAKPASEPAAKPREPAPSFSAEPRPARRGAERAPVSERAEGRTTRSADRREAESAARAAAARRAAQAEERRAARRAERLAARPPRRAPEPMPASDDRMQDWAVASQDLARAYFASFSEPNGVVLGTTPRFYGDRVVFHGRPMSLAALLSEKRRFLARWPERRYRARPDSIRTACNAGLATCQVDSTVDFMAANPDRGVRSEGTVAVRLALSFAGGRPVIVSESSRVLSRDRVAHQD